MFNFEYISHLVLVLLLLTLSRLTSAVFSIRPLKKEVVSSIEMEYLQSKQRTKFLPEQSSVFSFIALQLINSYRDNSTMIETGSLTYNANQLTCFYMSATLARNQAHLQQSIQERTK